MWESHTTEYLNIMNAPSYIFFSSLSSAPISSHTMKVSVCQHMSCDSCFRCFSVKSKRTRRTHDQRSTVTQNILSKKNCWQCMHQFDKLWSRRWEVWHSVSAHTHSKECLHITYLSFNSLLIVCSLIFSNSSWRFRINSLILFFCSPPLSTIWLHKSSSLVIKYKMYIIILWQFARKETLFLIWN